MIDVFRMISKLLREFKVSDFVVIIDNDLLKFTVFSEYEMPDKAFHFIRRSRELGLPVQNAFAPPTGLLHKFYKFKDIKVVQHFTPDLTQIAHERFVKNLESRVEII